MCLVLAIFKQKTIALKHIGNILVMKRLVLFLWNTWEIESTLSLPQPEFLKSQRTLSNFLDTLKN